MTKKKAETHPEQGQAGRPAKYQPRYAELVKMYIIELGAVNSRSEIAWGRIAKAMGLNVETLRRWRTKSSRYYKQDFAITVTQAVEEVDPNPAAVKAVLTNIGKKEERWSFKEGVAISADDPLERLLKEIGQKKYPLPRDEDISEFIDHKVNNG